MGKMNEWELEHVEDGVREAVSIIFERDLDEHPIPTNIYEWLKAIEETYYLDNCEYVIEQLKSLKYSMCSDVTDIIIDYGVANFDEQDEHINMILDNLMDWKNENKDKKVKEVFTPEEKTDVVNTIDWIVTELVEDLPGNLTEWIATLCSNNVDYSAVKKMVKRTHLTDGAVRECIQEYLNNPDTQQYNTDEQNNKIKMSMYN